MRTKVSSITLLVGILLILVFRGTVAQSATIYVPDNYETIQEAVGAANGGDNIIVRVGTHIIASKLTVPEQINLTFDPGVVVKFGGGCWLRLYGDLIAEGTSDAPIVFTSIKDDFYGGDTNDDEDATAPAKNDWGNILFWYNSDGSILDHVVVKYGGQTYSFPMWQSLPAIHVFTSNLVVSNSTITENGDYGIYVVDASPTILENVINNNSKSGIRLLNASPQIAGNTISGAGQNGIIAANSNPIIENNVIGDNAGWAIALDPSSSGARIKGNDLFGPNAGILVLAGDLEDSVTWNSDSVYVIDYYRDQYHKHLTVNEGATLTIEPGVVVKFEKFARLFVKGDLIAEGTQEAQIVFNSLKDDLHGGDTNGDGNLTAPGKNDWGNITLWYTSQQSVLDNTVVMYAGRTWSDYQYQTLPAVWVGTSNLEISNSTIADNGEDGIYAFPHVQSNIVIEGNIISENGRYGIRLYNASARVVGNTLAENQYGISLKYSPGSEVYLNNFMDNYQHAISTDSVCFWHSDRRSYTYNGNEYTNYLGNYWDDYTGTDAAGDGIGDTPYPIDSDQDSYPLMMPFENYEIGGEPPGENQPPIASFNYSPGNPESGEHVTFDGSGSNDPDGEIIIYEWDFEDGETAEGQVVSHRFRGIEDEAANYNVILTVKDASGQVGTDEKVITVTHLEKKAEVVVDDILGTGLSRIGAKTSYNWNKIEDGKDVFKISRIESWSNYFVGVYVISVENDSGVLWQKRIPAIPLDRTYYPDNIYAHASDWLRVTAYGVTEKEMLGIVSIALGLVGLPTMPPGDVPFFYGSDTTYFAPDYTDTSDFPTIDVEDTEILPFLMGRLCSPGELRVYDSQGHITGLVNGQIQEEIPQSAYFDGNFIIASPVDDYSYKVVGTDTATYDFVVIWLGTEQFNTFVATNIPTASGAIHEYTVDWGALSAGEEGVILKIDKNGDGFFEQMAIANNELSYDEFALQAETLVDFDPDTLNLKSKGKFVTVYIELPEDFDVSEIDLFSLTLNELVPPLPKPIEIGDYDSDGINDLMVKFDLQELIELLEPGEQIIDLTGRLWDGRPIAGFDFIRVIH